MNAFYEHHQGSIRFGYRCFDRILLNGVIQPFQQPERVIGFFNAYREQPAREPGRRCATSPPSFRTGSQNRAHTWGVPLLDAPPGRRDEFVEPYFKRAKPDAVVVILKAREPARILIAIGNKADNRWHLQFAQRWVIQYNFYVNDRPLGPDVRPRLPVFPLLGAGLSEPAPLAGQRAPDGGHRLPAVWQCLPDVPDPGAPPGARRLADGARPGALRREMAHPLHPLLHRAGTHRGRLSASAVLRPGRVLRQPDLSPAGRARRTGRAPAGCQSHYRPADQAHGDLRAPDHPPLSRAVADRHRESRTSPIP